MRGKSRLLGTTFDFSDILLLQLPRRSDGIHLRSKRIVCRMPKSRTAPPPETLLGLGADIFRERPTAECRAKYYDEVTGLYLQPLRETAAYFPQDALRRVVATSLFVFPQRVKVSATYGNKVGEYLRGVGKSLQYLAGVSPTWILRLYVDYSAAKESDDAAEQSLLDQIAAGIAALTNTYPNSLQVVAVRYARPGYQTGRTFLPALWRFLPAFDSTVDLMVCIDADNPISSLYMYFVDVWLQMDKRFFFLIPDAYNPPQCALSSTLNDYALCPIAQFWGARSSTRPLKSFSRSQILPREVLHKMLALTTDPSFRDVVLQVSEATSLLPLVGEVMRSSGGWEGLAAVTDYAELKARLMSAVREAIVRKLEERIPTRVPFEVALQDPAALAFITGFLFSRQLSKHNATIKMINPLALADTVEQMVASSAYGVDEWLLQIPLGLALQKNDALVLRTGNRAICPPQHDANRLAVC